LIEHWLADKQNL